MICNAKMPMPNGDSMVYLAAVYSSDPNSENKAFCDAAPNAMLQLQIAKDKLAAEQFERGKTYYVDFTPAE